MFRSAKARAARTSLKCASRTYSAAMSFQCPGGVYVLGAVGPLVGDGQLLAREVVDRVLDLGQLLLHLRATRWTAAGRALAATSAGVIIQALHLPEERAAWAGAAASPGSSTGSRPAPRSASRGPATGRGGAAGVLHAVAWPRAPRTPRPPPCPSARPAATSLARPCPTRARPRAARRPSRDLLDRRGEEQLQQLGGHAREDGVLRGIRGQVASSARGPGCRRPPWRATGRLYWYL